MRIAIDAHTVGSDLAGSVTYMTNLIDALAKIDQKNEYTIYVSRAEAYRDYSDRWPNFAVRRIRDRNRLTRLLFSFHSKLRLHPADILFVQYNAPPFAPCKIVTAIHDLAFEHVPDTFEFRDVKGMQRTIRRTALNSAHIITCSKYSRDDIIRTYGIVPEKVSTVLQAGREFLEPVTSAEEIARIRDKYVLSNDFILALGSIQPRKNLVRLIEAYSMLAAKRDVPDLVLAGKLAWLYDDVLRAVERLGVKERVRFTGFVPDEDLAGLYTAATCFVYPSYFEGFGLPPLEAMQCGTPVIAGNRTSIPEVVGDAGLLVDPFDVNAIADGIERVLVDIELRADLSKRGLARAREFSWLRTARETLDIFEKVFNDE